MGANRTSIGRVRTSLRCSGRARRTLAVAMAVLVVLPAGVRAEGARPAKPSPARLLRQGPPPQQPAPEALWPGPDGYGYVGTEIPFDWVDIAESGEAVYLADSELGGPFPIGFPFEFYGERYTEFWIQSDGAISFNEDYVLATSQCPLPRGGNATLIALMWDDLDPEETKDPVYYQAFETCPTGQGACLVVQFEGYHHDPGSRSVAGTFEAILFEDSDVVIQFEDAGDEQGTHSATGMTSSQASANWGLTYACGEAGSLRDRQAIKMALPEGVYLWPEASTASGCGDSTVEHPVRLCNRTGRPGTFALTYEGFSWATNGPSELDVAAGECVVFPVRVDVLCGGIEDSAVVHVEGNGYKDQVLLRTANGSDTWQPAPDSPIATAEHAAIAWDGKLYVVDGVGSGGAVQMWDGESWTVVSRGGPNGSPMDACLGLDADGRPVIDLIGDGLSFFDIRRFDLSSHTWSAFPIPAEFPSTEGIFGAAVVSMLQHTGENVCYFTGGATAFAGGDLNSLVAYYPADQSAIDLGDLSYSPDGINLHAAWYVPSIGDAGAICAGGGLDASGDVHDETQCYYLAAGEFSEPNVDLGPLPHAWWWGADAWQMHDGEMQIWLVNGLDENDVVLQESTYWSASQDGFVPGPEPRQALSALEADGFGDTVWASNGRDALAAPQSLQGHVLQCPVCEAHTLHVAYVEGFVVTDYLGRPVLRSHVGVVDQSGAARPGVLVEVSIWVPGSGPRTLSSSTRPSGAAHFHQGAAAYGTWKLCVEGLALSGYSYAAEENAVTCREWEY